MRQTLGIATICLLAGCAGSPPKPPEVQGEYRPVNRVDAAPSANATAANLKTLDFNFDGDIVAALNALRALQPHLTVLAPVGKYSHIPVRLNLHGVTLDDALRAIADQSKGKADVVLNTTGHTNGMNQVFIRFRGTSSQTNEPLVLTPSNPTNERASR